MKRPRLKAPLILSAAALILLCSGCLEQQETITVDRHGATKIDIEISGDPDQLSDPVLLPSGPDWKILERELDTTNNKPNLGVHAVAEVAPGSQFPPSFVPSGSPDYDLSLQFPGQVTVRTDGNRTYYTFSRNYKARRFAAFDFSEIPSLWDHDLESKVLDTGLQNVSKQDRQKYLEQLSSDYGYRYWRYYREALSSLLQSGALNDTTMQRLSDSAANYVEETITPDLVYSIMQRDEPQIQAALDSFAQLLDVHFLGTVSPVIGTRTKAIEQYKQAYARAHREYKITQELDGFEYNIDLIMPGTIVSTNGVLDSDKPGKVSWSFKGTKFHDADLPLYAVSVVNR